RDELPRGGCDVGGDRRDGLVAGGKKYQDRHRPGQRSRRSCPSRRSPRNGEQVRFHLIGNCASRSSIAISRATYERTGSPRSPAARKTLWLPSARLASSILSRLESRAPRARTTSTTLPTHDA